MDGEITTTRNIVTSWRLVKTELTAKARDCHRKGYADQISGARLASECNITATSSILH